MRRGLEAYLTSDTVRPPRRIDRLDSEVAGATGRVVPGFEAGSVVLVPAGAADDSGALRLVWRADDAERARPVPAGEWRVKGYLLERARDGATWFLSGAGMTGRTLKVAAGAESRLELDTAIHLRLRARHQRQKLNVALQITGDSGMGVMLLRDRTRVPVACLLADGEGKETARATMEYG